MKPFLLMCLLCTILIANSTQINITFINPGAKDDPFFGKMGSFMEVAAQNLSINLETIYCDRNHIRMEEEALKVLSRSKKPQYLLLINEMNAIASIIPKADSLGVKVFLFNEGVLNEERPLLGGVGENYKNWIGEMLPNDYQAGKLLAQTLIEEAKKKKLSAKDGKIYMVGLAGVKSTYSGISREKGLLDAVQADSQVVLLQLIPAYYDKEKAQTITKLIFDRYPNIQIIWSASDLMALGAVEALQEQKIKAGKDVLVGGIDWAQFALTNIEEDILTTSIGGHFTDGAWSLIVLYDHFHGITKEYQGKTPFSAITHENIEMFRNYFNETSWKEIDFKKFSKFHNNDLHLYNFSYKEIIEELSTANSGKHKE